MFHGYKKVHLKRKYTYCSTQEKFSDSLPVLRKIVCTPQLLDCFFKSVIKTNVNQLPFSF